MHNILPVSQKYDIGGHLQFTRSRGAILTTEFLAVVQIFSSLELAVFASASRPRAALAAIILMQCCTIRSNNILCDIVSFE